jgi:hypothetical protein
MLPAQPIKFMPFFLKNKGWELENGPFQAFTVVKRPTESFSSANPPRHHRPIFSTGSFHRQCISEDCHPASIHQ